MMRASLLSAGLITIAWLAVVPAHPQTGDDIRNVAGKDVEQLPDGSTGRVMEFRAADGSFIPAYLRWPKASGRVPIVVMLHGGPPDPEGTYTLGRTANPPTANLVAAGWAVLVTDFHPNPTVPTTDREDAMAAIAEVRRLPFIDPARVVLLGGSHGANVISRIASHVTVCCAVLCAPAVVDLIEISKAIDQGVEVAGVLKKMVAAAKQKYGVPLEQVALNPAKYNYESALTEAPNVRFPILIVNGRNDTSSPISVVQAYAGKLKESGKTAETYFPADGVHGFYFGHPGVTPETREAARRAVEFIRKQFAP
jgi:dipeptidyl aminopeptidase/acylaminoacyl peptidase